MQLVHKTVVFPAAALHSGGGGVGTAIAPLRKTAHFRKCKSRQSSAIIKSGALARF